MSFSAVDDENHRSISSRMRRGGCSLSFQDLEQHLYRAFAQLIRVFPLCRHDPASSQVSWPPRFPGWPSQIESVYIDMPSTGLAKFAPVTPARGSLFQPGAAWACRKEVNHHPASQKMSYISDEDTAGGAGPHG